MSRYTGWWREKLDKNGHPTGDFSPVLGQDRSNVYCERTSEEPDPVEINKPLPWRFDRTPIWQGFLRFFLRRR